jgi:RNA polymerase sigma-70 factor (sigma-E family)
VEAEIALGRDRGATLAELYATHGPRAGRLAYVLTQDRELAQDVAQEAFARLIVRLPTLRNPDAVEAYLRRSVVNLCRKHWRRVSRERSFLRLEGPPMATRTTAQPDVVRQDALRVALERLPYRQRAALILRFYEDLTERQTARALGCAVGTVKSLVFRGLRALREEIDDDEAD